MGSYQNLDPRHEKGVSIAVSGESIRKLSKNQYKVKSQTRDVWYDVTKTPDANVWSCSCPDFCYNLTRKDDKRCKHVRAVQTLQKTLERELNIEKLDVPKICPQCNSTEIVKNGLRTVHNNLKRQKYRCNQCHYRFSFHECGFSGMRFNPKIITETLNLYMSGMSYRKIARHVKSVHDVKVSHVSVYEWFVKYTEVIRGYVDTLMPELGDVWSLDEMMVNVKDTKQTGVGFYDWLWTIIDPQTRFVIATEVSKRRETKDARSIIAKGRAISKPSYVITDSLRTYEDAIRKELDSRKTAHIKTKSLSDGFQNRPIERYHNEIRETLKARRALGNDESTQRYAEAYKDYHNFVRPHTGLPDNMTPAEAAGIDLGLGHDRIRGLIAKGAERKDSLTAQLGKRIDKLNISNEKDCIKVYCKGWIERDEWKEVNNILRVNGFAWLPNGKDSCWIKMQS